MVDKNERKSRKSFLQRLRTDATGNTMAMAAAALFPIAGLIGGGVDIGRGYMAKARLQQACDAGALAGRRSMTGETMSAADKVQARRLFDFNFPEGTFGTDPFQPVGGEDNPRFVDGADPRTVSGYAETTIPTTLMKIFGNDSMTVKANCISQLDVGNVDIMMVLDVTGSMGGSRIQGLRDAVEDFYTTLGPGGADGSSLNQIRYGFVPYSANVNVGELLFNEDPTWLVGGTGVEAEDRWSYQTRRSTWEISAPPLGSPKSSNSVDTFESFTFLDGPECVSGYGNNEGVPGWFTPANTNNPIVTSSEVGSETIVITVEYDYESWDGDTAAPPAGAVGNAFWRDCDRKVTTTTEVYDTPVPETVDVWEPGADNFAGWEYGRFSHDVSRYVASIDPANPAAQRPTSNGAATDRWAGCIEERDTDSSIDATTTSIPAAALDLDIDTLPTDTASRWRPFWPEIKYEGVNDLATGAACPSARSRRLAEYASFDDGTANDLQSYVDSFVASGTTNHTIGMIWGARLLSAEGLFSTVNSNSSNGFPIGRHLVFMTDGTLNVKEDRYNVYGLNTLDGRVGPTSLSEAQVEARQAQRFQLMCAAVRAKNTTVWVVQFGVATVTANMENCATSPNHAAAASDNDALKEAFSNIAQTIGGLRLSQ